MKTNFDTYLDQQMADPAFASRFQKAGEAWDVALQITAARKRAGLSQKELADKLKTSQQQVSRLESPSYEGHSLRMLRRVAEAVGAEITFAFTPLASARVAETPAAYRARPDAKQSPAKARRIKKRRSKTTAL
ncbi:MAG: helix-turn-helix transcriptional regulator [Candidatus Competibacteraceae bacterium]|nr:helix-turn-helix transcriptional regulator [Candidatus Competibacteraceae bacterium]